MKGEDRELGMKRAISRRDFVQGSAVAAASASAGGCATTQTSVPIAFTPTTENYPPMRTGMRGAHPGSFEAAHNLAWYGQAPSGSESTGEVYDLVVVGAGLSGLAAAYLYRQQAGPRAKILVIDNHDDYGGHARRNEYLVDGRTFIATAGSSYLVAPSTWSRESKAVLESLGVERPSGGRGGGDLYRELGMSPGAFFRKEAYGSDTLVVGGSLRNPTMEFLNRTPLPENVKADLFRLMTGAIDYMPGMSAEAKVNALTSMSYHDYLLNIAKVHPDVIPFTQGVWCLGADMASAWFAYFRYKPGFDGLGVPRPEGSPEGPEHRADDFSLRGGNTEIARLLVRALIPGALREGPSAEIEEARTNYAALDQAGAATRIRLSSIVISARHVGARPFMFQADEREVELRYVRGDRAETVRARDVIMACNNNIIPFLCPDMPDAQKTALRAAVRAVNQTTSVLIRNWEAFANLRVNSIAMPNCFYGSMGLSDPGTVNGVTPPRSPSDPILLSFGTGGNSGILSNRTMAAELCGGEAPPIGTPADDQFRIVRAGLLNTPFEHFERTVRTLTANALGAGGFDPARDILAITVNRWPHGFATGRNVLFDQSPEGGDLSPTISARQKFGRIAIANSDAGGQSLVQAAFEQAHRAVSDLQPRVYGFYEQV